MNRWKYYEELKELARQTREEYSIHTHRVLKTDLRRIYRDRGIKIDLWPYGFKNLRGAYFNDKHGRSVLLARGLPPDPMVFTMTHELKHDLCDQDLGYIYCDVTNQNEHIEIGAEVFAAELIFPEQDFADVLNSMGVEKGMCVPEDLIKLKRETGTTLSYAGIVKRTEFLGFVLEGSLKHVQWKKLEERIYGLPIYKKIHRRRAKK